MNPDAYMWIGWPTSPKLDKYVAKLEGIDRVMENLAERGFKGIVIGPWSAVENPEGKHEYGPFDSEKYRESLRREIGSKVVKVDYYHPFNPTPRYYRATELEPQYMPEGSENVGKEYFEEIIKAASDRGLKVYYLWILVCPIKDYAPEGIQEITDVFGRRRGFACLNTPGLPEYMEGYLKDVLNNYPSLDGVVLDHLEFPSYVSSELFTCFCDGCRAKAESYGYNFGDLKLGVRRFYSWIKNLDEKQIKQILEDGVSPVDTMAKVFSDEDFVDWWQFRFESTNELAERIQGIVREVDPSLELHMDSVAPSFSPISGTDIVGLSKHCDMFNPKFYPTEDYWGWRNRLASYVNFIREGSDISESTALKFIIEMFGLKGLSEYESIDELKKGLFSTELFLNEAKKATHWYGDERRIRPWVWLDYALVDEIRNMVRAIADAKLEGAFFKQYSAATEKKLDVIQEEFGK